MLPFPVITALSYVCQHRTISYKSYHSAPDLFLPFNFQNGNILFKKKKLSSSEEIKEQVTNCACYYLINILVRYSPK